MLKRYDGILGDSQLFVFTREKGSEISGWLTTDT